MQTPKDFYLASKLNDNPFKENPALASHERASVWIGYEKENNKLQRVLTQTRSDQLGSTRFFLLFGNYGTGKTHALLWAQNLILEEQGDDFNSCVYFIRSLKTQGGKFSFYRAFEEYVINQSALIDDLKKFSNFLKSKVAKYQEEYGIPPDEDATKTIKAIFKAPELVSFAIELYQAVSPGQFEATVKVKDDFDSIIRFTSLVKLFTFNIPSLTVEDNRFKKAVYLFIDELDDLQGASTKESRVVNDHLRHLYDNCQGCFCLGIALSAELSELSYFFLDYVLSRIDRNIELSQMDKDQAMTFVKDMLQTSRTETTDDFYPFEEGAIDYLLEQIIQLTPRKVVKAMFETIELVRLGGFKPADNNLITLDVLDSLDVTEEVLESI
jgi:hypothetical protein